MEKIKNKIPKCDCGSKLIFDESGKHLACKKCGKAFPNANLEPGTPFINPTVTYRGRGKTSA